MVLKQKEMWSKVICLILILYFGKNFSSSEENLPEVDTPLGRVRGSWKEFESGRKYAAFEGIPYAKPPIGDLRFEEPQPITPWLGVWEANNLHTCIQTGYFDLSTILGDEDCLYVNVYIPAEYLNANKQLDVIVSIHGGAFAAGSGHMTNARSLIDGGRDVIVVSMNYRLSISGFLSTEDDAIPGNNGMKDQTLAMRWVKDNIRSFGGNPDSITLIGLSAGAASVHFHYLSPLSKGLFHRGMAQSGTALAPWAIRRNSGERAKKLAALVGCPTSCTKEMKKCLKRRPIRNLMAQLIHFYHSQDVEMPLTPFALVVEKQSPKAFLSEEPYLLLKEGKVYDVPLITSFTIEDGLLPSALFWKRLEFANENWKDIARYVLDYNDTLPDPTKDHIVDTISDYYLGVGEGINKKNFKKFTQMCTDRMFACSAEKAAKMQAKVTKSPVYFYLFNYEGEQKMVHFFSKADDISGVAHGDDSIYFYALNLYQKPWNEQDNHVKNACQDMVYSYATTGVPSFHGIEKWHPTGPTKLTYLNISGPGTTKLETVEKFSAYEFWAKLGLKENEYFMHNKDEL